MKKTLRLTALLLTAALLSVLCAGCFQISITLPEFTTAQQTQSGGVQQQTEAAPTEPATAALTPETQPAQSEPAASQPAEQPTAAEKKAPSAMNRDELLAYFNTALNNVKSSKAGFTKSKLTSIKDLHLSNSTANSLVGMVKGALLSETEEVTPVTKGSSSDGVMSPSGKSFVSNLTAADITDISAVQSGSSYTVTVKVKGETNPDTTSSACSKIFDFMTVDDVVNIYAPKVGATVSREKIEVVFANCYAKAVIDASGRVTSYETYVEGEMNMYDASIKKIITINTDLKILLGSTTKYSGFQY